METYFVDKETIDPHKDRISREGLAILDIVLDDCTGYLMDEDVINKILDTCSLSLANKKATRYTGISRLYLLPKAGSTDETVTPPGEVSSGEAAPTRKGTRSTKTKVAASPAPEPVVETFPVTVKLDIPCDDTRAMKDYIEGIRKLIQEVLTPVVCKKIVLNTPHGYTAAPIADGKVFYINVWSTPLDPATGIVTPTTIYGIKADCTQGITYSGTGLPIIDEKTGYVVAELVAGNNLYIHHDLVHVHSDRELDILAVILRDTVKLLGLSTEDRDKIISDYGKMVSSRSRSTFIDICSKGYKNAVGRKKDHMVDLKSKIERSQRDIANMMRDYDVIKLMVDTIGNSGEGILAEKFSEEYDKVMAMENVVSIGLKDGYLEISTKTIYCTDPATGNVYELGNYKICIGLTEGADLVRMYNLTRKPKAYSDNQMNGPHVYSDGRPCLGNIGEVVPGLAGTYEIAALVGVAIQFLETVNTADAAGKYIDRWPLYKEGTKGK
jgi:hypothetical protein